MSFISFAYVLFLPTVLIGYFALPESGRPWWLLAVSILFYTAFIPVYIFVIFTLILIDYGLGIRLEKASDDARRHYLFISLASNIGMLFCFKYFNFFNQQLLDFGSRLGLQYRPWQMTWALPLGLSFHVFQSLGYIIDVYNRRLRAERNFVIYALFVMVFFQMVAGPIERGNHLLPQLNTRRVFSYARAIAGLREIFWGFFAKMAIADRLAPCVNEIFTHPNQYSGAMIAYGTVLFGFQIYCDFMGYSRIAHGSARILGFDVVQNFERPYGSTSVTEFWRRWHISLSSWFRDYVYIPLGGIRVARSRQILNILIVFALSGLWHGANWTLVAWGLLNGFAVGVEKMMPDVSWPRWTQPLRNLLTFCFVMSTWLFFRASSMTAALYMLKRIIHGATVRSTPFVVSLFPRVGLLALMILLCAEIARPATGWNSWLEARPQGTRWAICYAAIFAFLAFASFEPNAFIYFQF